MKKIIVNEIAHSKTLRSRSSARIIIMCMLNEPPSRFIEIDFRDITFASRSFCNELLTYVKSRENVSIINMNPDVEEMVKIAFKKPKINLEYSFKDMGISI